ncbi:MAG: hypothetical protein JWO13_13 [Acidobacteriales bacterium]|nr:hypothetical protein [Terriglobales bacterium]
MTVEAPAVDSAQSPPQRIIAGFWRRVFAFVIDTIIVCIPCWVVGFAFFEFFARWEGWGFIVGSLITWPYFVLMGSSTGGGQTIGMRLLSIRVVNRDGRPITIGRSLLRYALLILPFTLNSATLTATVPSSISAVLDTVVTAAEFSIFYLYVFNIRTRQSLHDLVVESFVVDADHEEVVRVEPFWKGHFAIVAGVFLLLVIAGFIAQARIQKSEALAEALLIQKVLLSTGKIQSANVMMQENWHNGETAHGIELILKCKGATEDNQRLASEFAKIALQADPQAKKKDFIRVTLSQQFNVGLAQFRKTWTNVKSPTLWQEQ